MLERTPTGAFISGTTTGEAVRAFVPDPLPPPIELTPADYHLVEKANRALGRDLSFGYTTQSRGGRS